VKPGDVVRKKVKRGQPRLRAVLGRVRAVEGQRVRVGPTRALTGTLTSLWPIDLLEVVPLDDPTHPDVVPAPAGETVPKPPKPDGY